MARRNLGLPWPLPTIESDKLRLRLPRGSHMFGGAPMKRQRFVSQHSLTRILQEAAEAWKRQEYQQTIESLERVVRLDPANARVLLDLGRAYGLRYNYSAAERCLERAVRVAVKKVEALADAGRRSQEFGSDEMARRYWERAAAEPGVPASVLGHAV